LYKWAKDGTYNHRSAGTLSVESLYADFTGMSPSGTGNIQAADVEKLWGDIAVVNYYKHTPNK